MRLSKLQLKRIIREEYSRLKRRGLISETRRTRRNRRVLREQWMHNDGMGGPEDQEFPEGTPIEQAAKETVEYIASDYGAEVVQVISDNCMAGMSLDLMSEDEDDVGYAASEALEAMDYQGSGNYEIGAAAFALETAFARYGR